MGRTSLRAFIDDDVIGRLDPPVLCLPSHNKKGISTFGPRKEVFLHEGSHETNRSKLTKKPFSKASDRGVVREQLQDSHASREEVKCLWQGHLMLVHRQGKESLKLPSPIVEATVVAEAGIEKEKRETTLGNALPKVGGQGFYQVGVIELRKIIRRPEARILK